MIHIFIPQLNERIHYIFHTIFNERLAIDYILYDNLDYFNSIDSNYKIVYAPEYIDNIFYIQANSLLFETTIAKQHLQLSWLNDIPICFQTENTNAVLPFDIFAACFYFLSRYEEYLPHTKDKHNRYEAENSFAYQHNLLSHAFVDAWIDLFSKILLSQFPNLKIKKHRFCYLPTYDIDHAFLYKNKSLWITIMGFIKLLITGKWKEAQLRYQVISNRIDDPFDTYSYLDSLHKTYNLRPHFFILFAKRSTYDKNIPIDNKNFIHLIKKLESNATIGIHAAYSSSFSNFKRLNKEITNLQKHLKHPIHSNRQHYIRLRFPESYYNLIKNNITDDYSMGYVHHVGFRASTSYPFYFFDLQKNKTTSLKIHPFILMENALTNDLQLSEIKAFEKIKPCIDEVKKYNGQLITLFHNSSFNKNEKINFRSLYEKIIQYSISQ